MAHSLLSRYSTHNSNVRLVLFALIISQLKLVKLNAHQRFMSECIDKHILPAHVNIYLPIHLRMDKNIRRKSNSLAREMMIVEKRQLTEEARLRNMDRGHHWRSLKQLSTDNDFSNITEELQRVMTNHSRALFNTHAKKWIGLSGYPYEINMSLYDIHVQPTFPTEVGYSNLKVARLRQSTLDNTPTTVAYTNVSSVSLPECVVGLINKGPRFCFPPKIDNNFLFNLQLQIQRGMFGLRWNFHLKDRPNSGQIIPFSKNRVSIPRLIDANMEAHISVLKTQIFDIYSRETKILANSIH